MRIISQDGKWDLPYDRNAIVKSEQKIYAQSNLISSGDDNYVEIAQYSTQEKAEKAMKLLRQAYTDRCIINKDMRQEYIDKIMLELAKHGLGTVGYDSKVEFDNPNGYFKFPDDEEIEV